MENMFQRSRWGGARQGDWRRAPRDGLPESRVSAGSDFGESPEENEQESDESDDDFELRMATSSEDEDTNIAADEDAVALPPGGQRAKRQCDPPLVR